MFVFSYKVHFKIGQILSQAFNLCITSSMLLELFFFIRSGI